MSRFRAPVQKHKQTEQHNNTHNTKPQQAFRRKCFCVFTRFVQSVFSMVTMASLKATSKTFGRKVNKVRDACLTSMQSMWPNYCLSKRGDHSLV